MTEPATPDSEAPTDQEEPPARPCGCRGERQCAQHKQQARTLRYPVGRRRRE